MVRLDVHTLSAQLDSAARGQGVEVVVSAVVDSSGVQHVVSRYGDDLWDLWPFFEQSNVQGGRKTIDWGSFPESFKPDCKAVLYRYWKVGMPNGVEPPLATTIRRHATALLPFTRFLATVGVATFADVRPIHCTSFIHVQRSEGLSVDMLQKSRAAIRLLYMFREECSAPLDFDPWPDGVGAETVGDADVGGSVGKTKLIPADDLALIFKFAETTIQQADQLLDEVEAGARSFDTDPAVRLIRDACFFMLGILTGMRCEELAGVQVGAGRTEVQGGVKHHWVKSVEHKTRKGPVEYLMPAFGHTVLRVMERWSQPLRVRLASELAALQAVTGRSLALTELKRLAAIQQCKNALFLTLAKSRSGIAQMSGIGWHAAMNEFAERAGSDWALAPHQLRRTYAWTFVRHRLGNMLLLKEQFKHSSMSMTELYAANPQQDAALYEELLTEMSAFKVELLTRWTSDDSPLSGGAGRRIAQMRANAFDSREELIRDTAEAVRIRATGHAWCLAQDDGCGGAGLYEMSRCGGCGSSCIDRSQAAVWRELYDQQKELLDEAEHLGPGAQQRVRRDFETAHAVLTDLGLVEQKP
ncbi:tyrosine-type recombinase/integrase [Piscinibacterium candidicorallinum]|uniref:Tyrosine-type recombinase/integrase n=1 Tax=Piscinibacterium candidicorallinum TaxID=1793872 RepID=A0ABV7H9T9_9BURK